MEKIGPYQILEVLYGGPRKLYRARAADGRLVALKTIDGKGLPPEIRERFNREAAICKELDHPNVVHVYDSGEADGVLYQAMELLQGADLAKVLGEKRLLSWEDKISMMEQICDGLEYAHGRHLVHRDIKPANLFLENSGRVKILDFGMARVESSQLTQAGMALGTVSYMAPEQVRGETCTAPTDLFAAGIVFYELATSRHPFAEPGEKDMAKILTAVMFQEPPALKQLAPDAPEGLDLVLSKALEKDPQRRLQTASDFKQALWLCKVTLKLRRPATAPAAPAGAPAAEPADLAKTVVVRHPERPPAEPRPAPPPPPPREAPKPAPRPDFTFCPSCTHANPKGALRCARCGLALGAAPQPPREEPPDSRRSVIVIAAIAAVVVLLLIALLVKFLR